MRTLLLLCTLALADHLRAQCDFTPTVGPTGIILCPFATDTLTTQVYDTYQWFRNGQPIPGATQRTLPVAFQTDAGYRFHVAATLNGCTALSDTVLVDGWAFPTMMVTSAGDPPRALEGGGLLRYCAGDTATLTLNAPYTASITWFRDGVALPGEVDPTLVITTSGGYTAHAAPGLCPAVVFSLDVSVPMQFDPAPVPVILNIGGVLCASPFASDYAWYLNGGTDPVDIGTCHEPQEPGVYTAQRITTAECTAPSAPYYHFSTGMPEGAGAAPYSVQLLSGGLIRVQRPADAMRATAWRITDALGRTLRTGTFPPADQLEIPLDGLAGGVLLFQPLHADGAAAPATRFVLTH